MKLDLLSVGSLGQHWPSHLHCDRQALAWAPEGITRDQLPPSHTETSAPDLSVVDRGVLPRPPSRKGLLPSCRSAVSPRHSYRELPCTSHIPPMARPVAARGLDGGLATSTNGPVLTGTFSTS